MVDISASIQVELQDDQEPWILKIDRRKNMLEGFDVTFDGQTYNYDIELVNEICCLIAKDHIARHWKNELFVISSTLGFSPYSCKGRDVHKHLKHTLHLFKNVKTIKGAPDINFGYVSAKP